MTGVTAPASTGRSLARDRGGAIMVMGVFMAALMVGFLYYVKGLGDAILFRERMQDAADSAAFAAATVHARGMNLVALINISTVAILSIVAAARLVSRFLAPAAAAAALLHAPLQRPPIKAVGVAGEAHYDRLSRPLYAILRAGNTAANAVASAIPAAAEATAMEATGAFQPPVENAFLFPSLRRLPVEDSSIDELVARAGPPAVPLAIIPFFPFSVAMGVIAARRPELDGRATAQARAIMRPPNVNTATARFMVPQRLAASAVLGSDRLQVRAVVGGDFDFALSERGVQVASWGESEAADENEQGLAALSRISLAQAEYYYAGPGGRDVWLWNQHWRARLRRFRLDLDDQSCSAPTTDCDALVELLERGLDGAVVH